MNILQESDSERYAHLPHHIKSEEYWRQVLAQVNSPKTREYAGKILTTIMRRQGGYASDRQWEILDRARRGDTSPYHTKN